VLGISVSGDHLHRQALHKPDPDAAIRADLRAIHADSRLTYGRPRLVRALRACAHAVGHQRVARLMREEGLRGKAKGRFRPRTTDSRHARPVADNVLDRRFAVNSPVPAWVGGYLATVIRTAQCSATA
jgi:transposase InsO family protein